METVRGYHFSNSRESRERRRVPQVPLFGTWVLGSVFLSAEIPTPVGLRWLLFLHNQISRPHAGEEKPKIADLKDQRYISEGREKAGERGVVGDENVGAPTFKVLL